MSPIRKRFYSFLPGIVRVIIRLIGMTCRVQHHGLPKNITLAEHLSSGILSSWHGNIIYVSWCLRNQNIHVMVSRSRDGELISKFSAGFGFKYARGSSSKGATGATRTLLRYLKQNKPVAITPDGPRGPKHKLQPGILWLSAMSQKPMLGVHFEATRQWTVSGWDELKVPKPFSTIHAQWTQPLQIEREDLKNDEDKTVTEVEQWMLANTLAAKDRVK